MTITLTQEQLNYIFEFDRTRSIPIACDLATTLVEQVLAEEAKEAIK